MWEAPLCGDRRGAKALPPWRRPQGDGYRRADAAILRRRVLRVLARSRIRGFAPVLLRDERGRARRMEHLQVFGVVIAYRSQRHVHILEALRIFLDPLVDPPDAAVQNGESSELR